MEAQIVRGESSHRGNNTFLHKGKSDSLIPRWTSMERQSQTESISTSQRIVNRKGGSTYFQSSYPLYDVQYEGEHSPTPNSYMNMIRRTSSTGSLSLGVAGPLVFSSNHAITSILDGSKSSGEESIEMELMGGKIIQREKHNLNSDDNFVINVGHEDDHSVSPPPPISLKFVEVTYKVGINDEHSKWMRYVCGRVMMKRAAGERKEKKILKGITGKVEAGEVLALMGPSGSGKTTLLNLLSGRLHAADDDPHHHHGSITYNNMPFSKALKPRMGFVMQDDVLYQHLTVKETLVYAALLRLSKKLSKKERMERAMEVIYELGLERCQDTIIGGPFLRGVSGGERKRVCMGQEILIDPSLLFLDEPTSGLDSTTALRIIKMLQKFAQGGRTVVTTIHQPSSRLFHMFDKLILLSKGHMIYYGKASAAMDYFSSIGFSPQLAMNPADFLLDLASGNVMDISLPTHLLDEQHLITANATLPTCPPQSKIIRQYLSKAYEAAWEPGQNCKLVEELGMLAEEEMHVKDQEMPVLKKREWSSTWWSQFAVLYMRGLRERRHEYLSSLRVLQVIVSAFIIGCLWWRSSFRTERQLVDQVGLLFFIATYWGFFPLFTALFTFPQERAILAKERASDMYRLSAYFIARTLGDIPLDFCLPLAFHIIVYFMAHLRPTASAFFLTLITILLSTITSQGMGIAIGAIMMDLKKATTLASVALLTFMLSGGFFVQSIPSFISWIKFISYNYHTFKLLVKVQYNDGQQFDCATPMGCQKLVDSAIFKSLSLDGGNKEVLVLICMIIGYRLLAYIALCHMRLVV